MVVEPTQPKAWANLLTKMWGPRFPVAVEDVALEYSTRFTDPIRKIEACNLEGFEGALYPLHKSGAWAILINQAIVSRGRINFTTAHEFGHYLVHRMLYPHGLQCGEVQLHGLHANNQRRRIESEADEFASYLLMPIDDFKSQICSCEMTLQLLRHCAARYDVSLTAAARKWIEFTPECAALVVATNGFVLWCWRSTSAKLQRIFYPQGMPLPEASHAANPGLNVSDRGLLHPQNIWAEQREVREISIFADAYEMTISLLIFCQSMRPKSIRLREF